jgi:hypothetical protein
VLAFQFVGLLISTVLLIVVGRTGANRVRKLTLAIIISISFGIGLLFSEFLGVLGQSFGLPRSYELSVVMLAVGILLILGDKKMRSVASAGSKRPDSTLPRDYRQPAAQQDYAASGGGPLIFVSYRRDDSGHVTGRIFDRLSQHFGPDAVFKDVDSIPLGVDFRKHLAGSVAQCRLLLAVVGKDWARKNPIEGKTSLADERDFVRIEIESALDREIPVIPILVEGATFPNETALPSKLQVLTYHHALTVRPDPDFHSDVGRLIKGIEHHLTAQRPSGSKS